MADQSIMISNQIYLNFLKFDSFSLYKRIKESKKELTFFNFIIIEQQELCITLSCQFQTISQIKLNQIYLCNKIEIVKNYPNKSQSLNNLFIFRVDSFYFQLTYFAAILRQEIGWFDTINPNELKSRVANETFAVQGAIGEKVPTFIMTFSMSFFGFLIGYIYGWQLAIVVTTTLPAISIGEDFEVEKYF